MKKNFCIDGKIDLHGHTQDQAYASLLRFLISACKAGKKQILIVTGKGAIEKPSVIKTIVPRWLEYTELKAYVSNYCIAPISLGGSGALIVRLKKNLH